MPKGKKNRKKNRRAAAKPGHSKAANKLKELERFICDCMLLYNIDEITAKITFDGLDVDYYERTEDNGYRTNIDIADIFGLIQVCMRMYGIDRVHCKLYGNTVKLNYMFSAAQMPCNVFADVPSAAGNEKTLCGKLEAPTKCLV